MDAALAQAFAEPDLGHLQNTKAVVVLYRDTLVAERYARASLRTPRYRGWSMAKSVTNALVGILCGKVTFRSLTRRRCGRWQSDERQRITINDLLRMQSGLLWSENYFTVSDVSRMIFLAEDMSKEAARQPLAHPPGQKWLYSSGTTNVLSQIIRETVGGRTALGVSVSRVI